MTDFNEEYKKKLFAKWNKLSKEMTKVILEIDRENARPILEEIGYILLTYPEMQKFIIDYEMFLNKKAKAKKSIDKKPKKRENEEDKVVSIFDFMGRNKKED